MSIPGNATSHPSAPWFAGNGAVCGVGSLPFGAVAPALDFIARWCPEVPFWPQLRRMSPREAMIPQTFGSHARHLSPLRGEHGYGVSTDRVGRFFDALERAEPGFDPANAAGFFGFIDACERGVFSGARAVKGQMMGPITTACSITLEGTLLLDHPGYRIALADYVTRLARWQVEALLRCSSSVILVLDEAYLGVVLRQNPLRREAVVDVLKSVILRVRRPGVVVGIHCCDELPFSVLNEIEADLFSFDAHHGGRVFATDPEARRFIEGGGRIAWGWVPTLDDLSRIQPEGIIEQWLEAAAVLRPKDENAIACMRARSLVTAACGLAGTSPATCERSFKIATDISSGFARRAVPA